MNKNLKLGWRIFLPSMVAIFIWGGLAGGILADGDLTFTKSSTTNGSINNMVSSPIALFTAKVGSSAVIVKEIRLVITVPAGKSLRSLQFLWTGVSSANALTTMTGGRLVSLASGDNEVKVVFSSPKTLSVGSWTNFTIKAVPILGASKVNTNPFGVKVASYVNGDNEIVSTESVGLTQPIAVCGNGTIDSGEVCDGTNFNGASCLSLNVGTGSLSCSNTCQFNTSTCSVTTPPVTVQPFCGDGLANNAEQCDGSSLNGKTCATLGLGYTSGTLTCNSNCLFNTSACVTPPVVVPSVCGNNKKETGEICDGVDLDGATCVSRGFAGGTLSCSASCVFNTSACTSVVTPKPATCGDGIRNSNEQCDGADIPDGYNCVSLGFNLGGTLGCNSDCSFNTASCKRGADKCGDGYLATTETCDPGLSPLTGNHLYNTDCKAYGWVKGIVSCLNDCSKLDFSNCSNDTTAICGDGILSTGEVCDGRLLNGQTCTTQGFSAGYMTCSNCKGYDTSRCIAFNNSGVVSVKDNKTKPGSFALTASEDVMVNAIAVDLNIDTPLGQSLLRNQSATITGLASNEYPYDFLSEGFNLAGSDSAIAGNRKEVLYFKNGVKFSAGKTYTIKFIYHRTIGQEEVGGTPATYAFKGIDYKKLPPSCGNGQLNSNELCDGLNLNNQTCMGLGYPGGDLKCKSGCQAYDTTGCMAKAGPKCGDGKVDSGEYCDGDNLNLQTCSSRGFGGGILFCNSNCTFDTSNCGKSTKVIANDGLITYPEECVTGTNLYPEQFGKKNCQFFGYLGGNMVCNKNSKLDTINCIKEKNICGNKFKESGEVCDGSDVGGATCFTKGFDGGILACNKGCKSFDTSKCQPLSATKAEALKIRASKISHSGGSLAELSEWIAYVGVPQSILWQNIYWDKYMDSFSKYTSDKTILYSINNFITYYPVDPSDISLNSSAKRYKAVDDFVKINKTVPVTPNDWYKILNPNSESSNVLGVKTSSTLAEFFGGVLPSLKERATMSDDENYTGTYEQNMALLAKLKGIAN